MYPAPAHNGAGVERAMLAREIPTQFTGWKLFSALERTLATCMRTGTPCSLAFLDIYCMGTVNKRYGYAVGSEFLTAYEQAVKRLSYETGVVMRCGSDEFAILLPDIDESYGRALIVGVLRDLTRTVLHARSGQSVNLETNAGGATARGLGMTPEALIRAADSALASVKRRGSPSLEWARL
jgi:diguanylate cyclase (GGDEF)-like protein